MPITISTPPILRPRIETNVPCAKIAVRVFICLYARPAILEVGGPRPRGDADRDRDELGRPMAAESGS